MIVLINLLSLVVGFAAGFFSAFAIAGYIADEIGGDEDAAS